MKVRSDSLLVGIAIEGGRTLAFFFVAFVMLLMVAPNLVSGPKAPTDVSGAAVACALASIVAAFGFKEELAMAWQTPFSSRTRDWRDRLAPWIWVVLIAIAVPLVVSVAMYLAIRFF